MKIDCKGMLVGMAMIACSILQGCATTKIQNGMNALLGKPADQLFQYIGYPDSETRVAGRRLLIYRNSGTIYVPQTKTAKTQGTVYGTGGTATYSGTTSYQGSQAINLECELKVEVNDDNLIQSWSLYGNEGGCQRYSRLGQAANPKESKKLSKSVQRYERCSPQDIRMGKC